MTGVMPVAGRCATSSAITTAVPRRKPYGEATIRPTRIGISQSSLPSCECMICSTGSGRFAGACQSPIELRGTCWRRLRPLPAFSAGSHIDVHLPNGLTRQYSLCNDPSEGHRYLIGVLRDAASRGGSKAMHEQVEEGNVLHISAPKNHFPLAHEATHSVLVAGGIGVTPILCMAERLAVTGASFEMHAFAGTHGLS